MALCTAGRVRGLLCCKEDLYRVKCNKLGTFKAKFRHIDPILTLSRTMDKLQWSILRISTLKGQLTRILLNWSLKRLCNHITRGPYLILTISILQGMHSQGLMVRTQIGISKNLLRTSMIKIFKERGSPIIWIQLV